MFRQFDCQAFKRLTFNCLEEIFKIKNARIWTWVFGFGQCSMGYIGRATSSHPVNRTHLERGGLGLPPFLLNFVPWWL